MRAPLRLDGAELPLTTSIGVALGPHDAVPDQMMKDADTALSWAKAGGGNTFRMFAPAYGAAAVRSVGSDLDRRSA
jgi:GGDEF domain-containing protein